MKIKDEGHSSGKNREKKGWLEIQGLKCPELELFQFSIGRDETWCILGANNSGLEMIVSTLTGKIDPNDYDNVTVPDDFSIVSFSSQQELYEAEVRNDDSDYLNRIDPGTSAGSFLGDMVDASGLVKLFNLEHVLESGYRQLSTGESRKLLILEAITHGANHLLIENPYDGLDIDSCREFDRIAEGLKKQGVKLLVTLSSRYDVPGWCSHMLFVDKGVVACSGTRQAVLSDIDKQVAEGWREVTLTEGDETKEGRQELVRLKQGRASYGEKLIFSAFDLLVCDGDHTLITGPNGSGKSTLLAIITGDHPDCYTNELELFGVRRGSGESIWDLKKNMGIVSPALHRNHYIPGNTLQIVISGFFDSIGLYRQFTSSQEASAREWINTIGLSAYEKTPFRQLSFARQRLALIARALIKMPLSLIHI